jgi:hypothetical protein
MMWSGVGAQWFRAYALMLDGMVSHRMTGSPHPGGDGYGHETRERRLVNRRARGEIGIDECTSPWEINSKAACSTEVRGL